MHLIKTIIIIATLMIADLSASDHPMGYAIDTKVYKNSNHELVLKIFLTNISGREIKIYQQNLPWGDNGIFIKSAIMDDLFPRNLPMLYSMREYGVDYVLMANNMTLDGEINLSRLIPNIGELLNNHDIVIFWLYQLNLLDNTNLGEENGVIKITVSWSKQQ